MKTKFVHGGWLCVLCVGLLTGNARCDESGVRAVTGRSLGVGPKQLAMAGETNVVTLSMSTNGVLRILCDQLVGTSVSNTVLAELPVGEIGDCGCDFAFSPSGRVLWIFAETKSPVFRTWEFVVHSLTNKGERMWSGYEVLSRRKMVAGKECQVEVQMDVGAAVRDICAIKAKSKTPITFSRDDRISSVKIGSTNDLELVVNGTIGKKYEFSGSVLLTAENTLTRRGFDITPIDVKSADTNSAAALSEKTR